MRKQIPNLCSLASLAFGFAALEAVLSGYQDWALRHLLMANFFDLLAGRLALALQARSPLGVELDQLGSLATQGIVPMAFAWQFTLRQLGPWGLGMAAAAVLAAAFRLSRDNTATPEAGEYRGLPLAVFGTGAALMTGAGLHPWLVFVGIGAMVLLLHNSWGYLRMPQDPLFPALTAVLLLLAVFITEGAPRGLLLALGAIYASLGHVPPLKRLELLKPAEVPEEKTA